MTVRVHTHANKAALAEALATEIEIELTAALANRDRAHLAVSGGTTPITFFQCLSRKPLNWKRVDVFPVDERWVDEGSTRSNARLIKSELLREQAASARFHPLYNGAADPRAGLPAVEAEYRPIARALDVVVLGMGLDGHTASLFPHGDTLAEALDPGADATFTAMNAPGAGEPRITLTAAAILRARRRFLHVEGIEKHRVLEEARSAGPVTDMPIRAFLDKAGGPLDIYWCP
ncbi:MAG: 6-phosphogluconolactonase [Pseudomonadota bacterium]